MLKNPYRQYYQRIVEYYDDRITERSKIPLINHINEGIIIMKKFGATETAMAAYCLHPMFQNDVDLIESIGSWSYENMSRYMLLLVMEYRHTANSFLCRPNTDHYTAANMPTIINEDVRLMLVADKIQNRKDCDVYHTEHKRYIELSNYFKLWLTHLGISEEEYQNIIKDL